MQATVNGTEMVSVLIELGGSEWIRGDMHRIYFNNLADWYGEYDGKNSNAARRRWFSGLNDSKVYFNVVDGKFYYKQGMGVDRNTLLVIIQEIRGRAETIIAEREAVQVGEPANAATTQDEFGIGRVPADVDPEREALAQLDAMERNQARTPSSDTFICPGCGRTEPRRMAMSASFGTVCPDCYDDYSG